MGEEYTEEMEDTHGDMRKDRELAATGGEME